MQKLSAAESAPVRISLAAIEKARQQSDRTGRSIGAQVEHWMELGQLMERLPSFSQARVSAALDGRMNPDQLSDLEGEVYHAELTQRLDAPPSDAELAFYASLGEQPGAVGYDGDDYVQVQADGSTKVLRSPSAG